MGAWIEIYALKCQHDGVTVAPHVGAWIEILMEVISRFPYDVSHPTWVRGLKSRGESSTSPLYKSHPTWVRGLKSLQIQMTSIMVCRTPRGCVD